MDIKNKSVLILGGWGLVGRAITRKIMKEQPKHIIITSLKKEEALSEVESLKLEFPKQPKGFFIPWWGNILSRDEFKDRDRGELLSNPETRKVLVKDTLDDLNDDILKNSSLYKLLTKYKPDVVIDCINTATGIAYQDIYSLYKTIRPLLEDTKGFTALAAETERLLASMYIPQLIRHMQILYNSLHASKTTIYFKIGTSGTGGMGLNIPYTHSEEKPSRVLLSKSAVAGAHTLLLFLMARTPDSAIIKEIKPTAAIAWKKIEFNSIKRRGKAIELVDVDFKEAENLTEVFSAKPKKQYRTSGAPLRSVYIDTGENGIFSRGEFEAITAQRQMEFVTPEEIAENTIFEIKGGNTGHDVINALDNASLHPSYRAGYLQHFAVNKMAKLEKENNVFSVAFEMLGPPRLSKLLFEIHLLKLCYGTLDAIPKQQPLKVSEKITALLNENDALRNEILSIGIPILLPSGKQLLRGNDIKVPRINAPVKTTPKLIEDWAAAGWVDLRVSNWKRWIKRVKDLIAESETIPVEDTSSQHVRNKEYWNNYQEIDVGRVVSWIFIHEEKGTRMKD